MSRFSKVPWWLLDLIAEGGLSGATLITYVSLGKYVNWHTGTGAWPSVETLTKDTGLSERTVRGHITMLTEAGVIRRTERFVAGHQTTNLIELLEQRLHPGVQDSAGRGAADDQRQDSAGVGVQDSAPKQEPYEQDAAAAVPEVRTEQQQDDVPDSGTLPPEALKDEETKALHRMVFPTVEQRKLVDWFGIRDGDRAAAWISAWDTAEQIDSTSAIYFEPQVHLAGYLSRCREERRQPRSDLWLRFFIEDRAKHIQTLAAEADKIERRDEDPTEREERRARQLPPADWGTDEEN